jgi:NADH-quinone oxidoreductase subunit E
MLGMAHIRALEVATFYFMFQLQPVGTVAHVQICGTTSCMICGAGELIEVCREKIAAQPFTLSADGKFSWEEVECLGSCANAPMVQIGKDYYEDLTAERFAAILDELAAGKVPVPGPQNGRYSSEPLTGLTSLKEFESGRTQYNASVQRAVDLKDTVKRIDGTEVPILTPWTGKAAPATPAKGKAREPKPAKGVAADATGVTVQEAPATSKGKPAEAEPAPARAKKPRALKAPRKGGADDLKQIKGVGPKLEALLHSLGFFHFDQVAQWTAEELAWVDDNIEGFKGRASRDGWVEQARLLAAGGETEFSRRVRKGDVY